MQADKCALYHRHINRGGEDRVCNTQCPSCVIWFGKDESNDATTHEDDVQDAPGDARERRPA